MSIKTIKYIGRSLYQVNILKEKKRYIVFLVRYYLHKQQIDSLLSFFAMSPIRQDMVLKTVSFVEQVTRNFFYKNSTYDERIDIVKNHVSHLEQVLKEDALKTLYIDGKPLKVWEDNDKSLSLELSFYAGQRKEGCLSLVLSLCGDDGKYSLYQIIFWFAPSVEDNLPSLWIGALQGSPEASETIKDLTKAFFGYRTKNLIFYGIRNVAKLLFCKHIYAVSNYGYYAMNNIRVDRKLKTSLDEFWQECDGKISKDRRFYDIPMEESRKSIDELKSQKRSQYKKRFAKMDEIAALIDENLTIHKR